MLFLLAAVAAGIAYINREALSGKIGELKTPADTSSNEFKQRQAVREYKDLLDGTDPSASPGDTSCIPCMASEKGKRRKQRHDLARATQSQAKIEKDPVRQKQMLGQAQRLCDDMDRVEDAKLALHSYTANENSATQRKLLAPLRDIAPPGFKLALLDDVADDFGVDPDKLADIVNDPENSSQKIMIYERDEAVLGPGPKYTVAFRGSTLDVRDWNNNGRNEAGFEAPHQKNAARLGKFLGAGALRQGKPIDSLVSATGHSKGGSEAQAFGAASGAPVRVFNPAGFDAKVYGLSGSNLHMDRTSVVERDANGIALESTETAPHTDPLYYAQHRGVSQYVMQKPMATGTVRELSPIDPNLSVPSATQSDSEAHSMLQVVEALERDKGSDEAAMKAYTG